ncbi:tetratricopeptide repeat protein, partial [Streptomyces sp. NPDC058274]|uniref:tetratricopeptide repeat protein n=1 Tax=Streptomyces sp. NPDC058274 TaxID=3346416 RepID=UPI0036E05326
YRTVLADCVENLGVRHPGTLAVRHNLADLLRARGELALSEAEFTEVRAACEEVLGERHPRTRAAEEALREVARLRAEARAAGVPPPRPPGGDPDDEAHRL